MKLTKLKLKEIIREEILAEAKELPKVGDNVDIVTSSYYVQKIKKVSGDYVVVDNRKGKKAPAVILGKKKDKLGLYNASFKIKINNLKKSKYQHQSTIGITSWVLKSGKRAIDGKDLEFDQMGRGKLFGFVNEGKLTEAMPYPKQPHELSNTMQVIKKVVDDKQYQKYGGTLVDLTTASLIWNLYQAVNDSNKKKLNKLGVKALANIAFKIASKAGKSGRM